MQAVLPEMLQPAAIPVGTQGVSHQPPPASHLQQRQLPQHSGPYGLVDEEDDDDANDTAQLPQDEQVIQRERSCFRTA